MTDGLRSAAEHDADVVLSQFETAWQSGAWPRIDQFLSTAWQGKGREIVEELVKMDLEYRWWRTAAASGDADCPGKSSTPPSADALGGRPRLEDYLRQYPQLGPPQNLSVELIGEEYRVRK